MNCGHSLLRVFKMIGFVLALGVSMSADAGFLGIGGTSWKEEGNKLGVRSSLIANPIRYDR